MVPITIGGANTSEVDQLVALGSGPSEKSLHSMMTIERFTRYRSMGPNMASFSATTRGFFCMEATAVTVAKAAAVVSAIAQWEAAAGVVVVQGPSDRTDDSGVQQRSHTEIYPAPLLAIGDQRMIKKGKIQ